MNIHVYLHSETSAQLDRIEALLRVLEAQENKIMDNLAALTTQVEANTSAEGSAIALINGLVAELKTAGTDPQKLQDLTTKLETSRAALAAAVVANTPAAPPKPEPGTDPAPNPTQPPAGTDPVHGV